MRKLMIRKHIKIGRFVLFLAVLMVGGENLYGIPAFARKYGKPCQTCHVSEPKLNRFGELFRANGYQLPGVIEDTAPWTISKVAISGMLHEMFVNRNITNNMSATPPPGLPPGKTYNVRSFRDMGGHLWMGGTLGKHLSYFTALGIEQELEVEDGRFGSSTHAHWEQAFFQYNNIFNSRTGFANIKFGSFELELPFSNLRRLSSELSQYEVYNLQGVKGSFKLSSAQVGTSINGLKHLGVNSIRYELALVNGTNGNFDTNVEFDIYGRLAITRLFDGVMKSLRVGGLYYTGKQNLRDLSGNPYPTSEMIDYWKDEYKINVHIDPENKSFYRWGLDLSLDVELLGYPVNFYGQYIVGHDDDIDMTDHDVPCLSCGSDGDEGGGGGHKLAKSAEVEFEDVVRPFDYSGGFVGADVILMPSKLYFIGRYDWVNVTNQWADPVDGKYIIRDDMGYDHDGDPSTGDIVRGDVMPFGMTNGKGTKGKFGRYTLALRYHFSQPVAVLLEYGKQDNLFGYPEPPNQMYNPDWVAGMGRVVDIDSDWFMLMIMFAF